jgi:hypothetical protein
MPNSTLPSPPNTLADNELPLGINKDYRLLFFLLELVANFVYSGGLIQPVNSPAVNSIVFLSKALKLLGLFYLYHY